jgi:hypothetical protein
MNDGAIANTAQQPWIKDALCKDVIHAVTATPAGSAAAPMGKPLLQSIIRLGVASAAATLPAVSPVASVTHAAA